MAEFNVLDGSVRVSPYALTALGPDEGYGVSGTLYFGDADLIADYIASPIGELDVHGVIHHIHMEYRADQYALSIDFLGDRREVHFDHMTAREIVLALATIPNPSNTNPNRR